MHSSDAVQNERTLSRPVPLQQQYPPGYSRPRQSWSKRYQYLYGWYEKTLHERMYAQTSLTLRSPGQDLCRVVQWGDRLLELRYAGVEAGENGYKR